MLKLKLKLFIIYSLAHVCLSVPEFGQGPLLYSNRQQKGLDYARKACEMHSQVSGIPSQLTDDGKLKFNQLLVNIENTIKQQSSSVLQTCFNSYGTDFQNQVTSNQNFERFLDTLGFKMTSGQFTANLDKNIGDFCDSLPSIQEIYSNMSNNELEEFNKLYICMKNTVKEKMPFLFSQVLSSNSDLLTYNEADMAVISSQFSPMLSMVYSNVMN